MKRFHVIATAIVAVFAFFAVGAASAVAAQPVWLVLNGLLVGKAPAEMEGEINLVRLNMGARVGNIKCIVAFRGSITNPGGGAKGIDEITALLNTNDEDVGNDGSTLSGPGLACEVTEDVGDLTVCKTGGIGSATVWPANLPWKTELELMANNQILDLIGVGAAAGSEPGFEIECIVLLGVKATDLCESKTSMLVSEGTGAWPGTVAEGAPWEFNAESEASLCKTAGGGELVLDPVGKGILWAIEQDLKRVETDVSEE